jgi:hypothetical protein
MAMSNQIRRERATVLQLVVPYILLGLLASGAVVVERIRAHGISDDWESSLAQLVQAVGADARRLGERIRSEPVPPDPVAAAVVARAATVVETPAPALRLTGVVWNEDRPLAFVNGAVVGVGDEVAGVRVVEIQPDRIVVTTAVGRVTIQLYDQRDAP